jgi:hypothetical protein
MTYQKPLSHRQDTHLSEIPVKVDLSNVVIVFNDNFTFQLHPLLHLRLSDHFLDHA